MKTKITVLGDSISKGVIYENDKLCLAKNPAINMIGEELDYEIQNYSSYGQSVKRIFDKKLYENILKDKDDSKDNYLILSIGGNDADYDWKNVALEPDKEHKSKTDLAEFSHFYQQLVKIFCENGYKVIVCSIFPINSQWYFDNVISRFGDKQNILKFLCNDLSNITRHQELFNNEIIKIAIGQNLKFYDVRKIFLQQNNCFDYYCADGIHLNQKGHEFVANFIINQKTK